MTSPRLLVIQPSPADPPARLGEWLTAAGATLSVVSPATQPLPELTGYHGVVCLGGEMGANDDATFPWLAEVRALLSRTVSQRLPLLSICLGAQLLAVATGGQVRIGASGPVVGARLVAKRDVAAADPLFADLPLTPDVLQFHNDEISVLPPRAELLASAAPYAHQAFRVGAVGYGLQFHIETTPDIVLDWVRDAPDEAEHARPGELEPDALIETHDAIGEAWQPFAERFVRLSAGDLPPARDMVRNLPLA
ncbi:MAG: type 1 glutamine amidotransferase [Kutzneria sp.]|nr:type 1 glutamine amidotransferase [Kutzneria sp.]